MLGGFILFIGFMAFNGGSAIDNTTMRDGTGVASSIVNTVLGGAAGGITSMLAYKCKRRHIMVEVSPQGHVTHWSCIMTINGAIAGKVLKTIC